MSSSSDSSARSHLAKVRPDRRFGDQLGLRDRDAAVGNQLVADKDDSSDDDSEGILRRISLRPP